MMQTLVPASLTGRLGGLYDLAGTGLLPHAAQIRSHSRAEARASVERLFFSHRLAPARDVADVDFSLRSCMMGATSFNVIRYGVDIDVAAAEDEADRYVLVVPLAGECSVKYLGRVHYVDPGGFIVLKPGARFDFSMSRDHTHLAVGITRPTMASAIARNFDRSVEPRNFVLAGSAQTAPGDHTVIAFLAFICEQLAADEASQSRNPFAAILERSFIALLGEFMAGVDRGGAQTKQGNRAPRYVTAAEQFMRANLEEDIGAEDIIAAAGVPMRTLYHGFQTHRGASPLSWLKSERLRAARHSLLTASSGETVTEVASKYYNANLGRFSRQYYQEFGEYPSETLRRAALDPSDDV